MAPRQPVAFTPPTPSFSSFLDGEVIIIETSGRTRGFGGKSLCCAVKPTPRDGPRKGCNKGKRALESSVYIKQFPSNTLKSDLLFQYTYRSRHQSREKGGAPTAAPVDGRFDNLAQTDRRPSQDGGGGREDDGPFSSSSFPD